MGIACQKDRDWNEELTRGAYHGERASKLLQQGIAVREQNLKQFVANAVHRRRVVLLRTGKQNHHSSRVRNMFHKKKYYLVCSHKKRDHR